MTATAVIVLLVVLLAFAAFYISRFLGLRAVRVVVLMFREQGATNAKSAKSLDELGLTPARLMGRMFKGRDYRPQALRLLGRAEIIRATEGGKLYLSEQALENSYIKKAAGIK